MNLKACMTLTSLLLMSNTLHANSSGQDIFQQACARCHQDGPGAFTTRPDKMRALLQSNNIRQHRFNLSNTEFEELISYLARNKDR